MEANMNFRKENRWSKSYNLKVIGSVALVAVLLILAAVYALAVQFPIGAEELATFVFPP
jgi:hypothetical protein